MIGAEKQINLHLEIGLPEGYSSWLIKQDTTPQGDKNSQSRVMTLPTDGGII